MFYCPICRVIQILDTNCMHLCQILTFTTIINNAFESML